MPSRSFPVGTFSLHRPLFCFPLDNRTAPTHRHCCFMPLSLCPAALVFSSLWPAVCESPSAPFCFLLFLPRFRPTKCFRPNLTSGFICRHEKYPLSFFPFFFFLDLQPVVFFPFSSIACSFFTRVGWPFPPAWSKGRFFFLSC